MKIHLGADHAGFELKEAVKAYLSKQGHEVTDHGANEYVKLDDYPDYIFPAAYAVAGNPKSRGIIFGGSGQGEAMTANRVKGVRATVYYDGPKEIILLGRRHNNSNILSLGARFISVEKAIQVIDLWLKEPFEGDRHEMRIKKMDR